MRDHEQPRDSSFSKESLNSSCGQPKFRAFNPAPDLEISSDGMSISEPEVVNEEAKGPTKQEATQNDNRIRVGRFINQDRAAVVPQTAERDQ